MESKSCDENGKGGDFTTANSNCRGITSLPMDALIHCFQRLDVRDLCNAATTCRYLKEVAYSDPVWDTQSRLRWSSKQIQGDMFQRFSSREAYLSRHSATQKLQFFDPMNLQFRVSESVISHIALHKNIVIAAQGTEIHKLSVGDGDRTLSSIQTLRGHKARITCLRMFPLECETTLRDELDGKNNVLVTSSCDHMIRIWRKSNCQRTLRGHTGPVTVLANGLLGKYGTPVLASGSLDCTVRLWSLSSHTRGRSTLRATLHGHETSLKDMAIADHNSSLLVSISKDSKIRVWDTNTSGLSVSSGCVGMTRVQGLPVGLKCIGPLCYIASSAAVVAIDLRSMKTVATVSPHKNDLLAFDILASRSIICTGSSDKKAKLWDIRNASIQQESEPFAILDNHSGPVTLVHIDTYKVVTGGTEDKCLSIWDTGTGDEIRGIDCDDRIDSTDAGISALAVKGARVATGSCGELAGLIHVRDFNHCTLPMLSENEFSMNRTKFWERNFDSAA